MSAGDGRGRDLTDIPSLIAVVGPTGTGKSALSLELAHRLGERGLPVEIVNADAMQLYGGMDIGTAKLAPDERHGVPHHLLDILEVTELSTVADYQRLARERVREISERGAVPVLVGGSGLYVSAVVHNLRFPGTDVWVRTRLEAELAERGAAELWRRLEEADPDAAQVIDPANGRRIVRALEVIEITGEPYSATLPEMSAELIDTRILLLDVPLAERPALKERLARRAQGMFDAGLLDEVRDLVPQGLAVGPTASRAIGYAQAIDVLAGRASVAEAVEQTTLLTHRYVRRQRSWFGRYTEAVRLDATRPSVADDALAAVLSTSR